MTKSYQLYYRICDTYYGSRLEMMFPLPTELSATKKRKLLNSLLETRNIPQETNPIVNSIIDDVSSIFCKQGVLFQQALLTTIRNEQYVSLYFAVPDKLFDKILSNIASKFDICKFA